MKKKQFKRLEHLLTDLVETNIHQAEQVRQIKGDQRAIAETNAEGGAEILSHLSQIVSLLESDDPQDALNAIAGFGEEQARSLDKLVEQGADRPVFKQLDLISRSGALTVEKLVDIHNCMDAWGKFFQEDAVAEDIQREAVARFEARTDETGGWVAAKDHQELKGQLRETEERLKLALEDLGGHKEGLPQDASVGHFRNWVGGHGFKWIAGHRKPLMEYLDRMEREAAYNRGNAIVQDAITTEDRGVVTTTLGPKRDDIEPPKSQTLLGGRPIQDNPQA